MDAQGRKRQDRQYNRHHRTRLLPAVIPGQNVWITMEQTPRSYLVETKKGLFRHLRPTDQSTSDAPSPVRQVNPSREANILPFAKQLRAASLLADEYLGFADKHLICYQDHRSLPEKGLSGQRAGDTPCKHRRPLDDLPGWHAVLCYPFRAASFRATRSLGHLIATIGVPRASPGQKPGRLSGGTQTAVAVSGEGPGCGKVCLIGHTYLSWPYFWTSCRGDSAMFSQRARGVLTGGSDAPLPCLGTGKGEAMASGSYYDNSDYPDPYGSMG
ncbi:UNVERIFIED_CONTAM: hypothetical protein FKN15_032484 [Acipenser sinensis]